MHLYFDAAGVLLGVAQTPIDDALMGAAPDVAASLTVEAATNPALATALVAAPAAYRLTNGTLTKDDAAVTIHPPAPATPTLGEQLAEALAQLPADQPVTGAQLAGVIALLRGLS